MGQGMSRLGAIALVVAAGALVAGVWVAASTWERVRTQPGSRTVKVTGSAKKRIVSDLIEWSATVETHAAERTAAYRALRGHVDTTLAYLKAQGLPDEAIRVSSVSTREVIQTEYVGTGEDRIMREIPAGWDAWQSISVTSADVARVERISREVTQLLEQGVPITSSAPAYFYTRLGEVKIDMLAEAAADARNRAEHIVKAAGGAALASLAVARMGVININPANSTATSWDGNNDKTSLEKDILTIVHLTYSLD